jgi:hypothetical protein
MKKLLKLTMKGLLGIITVLLIAFVALLVIYNEDVPEGKANADADILAHKMLDALHVERFNNVSEIHWTFRNKNSYKWNLKKNSVEVFWDDYHVTYDTRNRSNSSAYLNETPLNGNAKEEALSYAISNFNNDSFWVVAPFKVFDPGTTRSVVLEEGKQYLLVQYSTGGTTPGDAYLWELDEDYKPIAFKMWVSILPFDGLEAKWTDWKMTDGGFLLSHQKSIFGLEIPVTNLKVIP